MRTTNEFPEANNELRSEKITSLRKAIEEGKYKIRSEEIASAILKEIVLEHHLEKHR